MNKDRIYRNHDSDFLKLCSEEGTLVYILMFHVKHWKD